MKPINPRTAAETYAVHTKTVVEVYSHPASIQHQRIEVTRNMACRALRELPQVKPNERIKIIELGCGTGDISGWISENYSPTTVKGYESSLAPTAVARQKWPKMTVRVGDLQEATPEFCDLLIMCEILEHLAHPVEIVARWAQRAKAVIISHPIDESPTHDLSCGCHVWSLSMDDWTNWFVLGCHQIEEHIILKVGQYNIAVGRGRLLQGATNAK